jgi:uncharacterized membrane protein YsdA (DUF1294 family)
MKPPKIGAFQMGHKTQKATFKMGLTFLILIYEDHVPKKST